MNNVFNLQPKITLIDALRKLFYKEGHEEIMYPIIKTYFFYSIGELHEMDEEDFNNLRKAINILEDPALK